MNVIVDTPCFPKGVGFAAAMAGLNVARTGVAAMCNGAVEGALRAAIEYANSRTAFGSKIFDNQGTSFSLADVSTYLEASRNLTQKAAQLIDYGQDATLAASHAKKFATKHAFQSISACLQVMGANGLKDSYGIHRQMSAARACEFMDGTTEIQNMIVARALLKSARQK
ncbi:MULTISPECIES: acyl-CoA dehydrogenase family protein [unclassified Pseudomonas]|uniref:acyl-CoA dehydrogenase family protein n=1 Tax=unclassified Pseudomonas TaxID=196821 RepID=UPI001486A05D|nr:MULTISPECIES: acyl-CoA dehydrogenase family protein [unclassified Pseudomonas]